MLVPRHFERSHEVGRELEARGLKFVYRSELMPHPRFEPGAIDCLVVNTTGELRYFYEQATIVFVGKSLAAEGGQNPIEPGALGKAMVFGPHMQNFVEVVRDFLEQKGAVQVQDAAELEQVMGELLAEDLRRDQLGRNALRVVREKLGAIDRTTDLIVNHLASSGRYPASLP